MPMTLTREAQQRGGQTTAARYDAAHFAAIGRRGGLAVRAKHGPDYHARIGRLGGLAVKAKHGPEYYQRIGLLRKHPGRRARGTGDG